MLHGMTVVDRAMLKVGSHCGAKPASSSLFIVLRLCVPPVTHCSAPFPSTSRPLPSLTLAVHTEVLVQSTLATHPEYLRVNTFGPPCGTVSTGLPQADSVSYNLDHAQSWSSQPVEPKKNQNSCRNNKNAAMCGVGSSSAHTTGGAAVAFGTHDLFSCW